MHLFNLFENRRPLESRVLDLIATKGEFYASNLVCAFLRWDIVPLLNKLRAQGRVTFHVVPPFWGEPLVVLAGHPQEWPRVNLVLIGVHGTIGQVRFRGAGRAAGKKANDDGGIERMLRSLGGSRCAPPRIRAASCDRATNE